jgi:hypothetical protein
MPIDCRHFKSSLLVGGMTAVGLKRPFTSCENMGDGGYSSNARHNQLSGQSRLRPSVYSPPSPSKLAGSTNWPIWPCVILGLFCLLMLPQYHSEKSEAGTSTKIPATTKATLVGSKPKPFKKPNSIRTTTTTNTSAAIVKEIAQKRLRALGNFANGRFSSSLCFMMMLKQREFAR